MIDFMHLLILSVEINSNLSIIEICSLDMQQERENYFLEKYLPLLNTIFKSNLSDIQTFDSLYELLKVRQLESSFENKYQGIYIYLYEYVNGQLTTNCKTFNSINELSNYLGVARETLSIYLNTYVPFRNNLFLTNKIESFELTEKLISDATLTPYILSEYDPSGIPGAPADPPKGG
jgi:hypothetical protein